MIRQTYDFFLFIPPYMISGTTAKAWLDDAGRQFIIGFCKIELHSPYQIASYLATEIIILQKNNMWTRAIH